MATEKKPAVKKTAATSKIVAAEMPLPILATHIKPQATKKVAVAKKTATLKPTEKPAKSVAAKKTVVTVGESVSPARAPEKVTPATAKQVTKVAKAVSVKKTPVSDKPAAKSATVITDVKTKPVAKTILSSLAAWPFPTETKP